MEKIDVMLVIVLSIDMIIFFGQLAMLDVNPDAPLIYNYEDSRLSQFDKGNYTVLDADNALSDIPNAATSVSTDADAAGNWITDTFKTIKSWVGDSTIGKGAKYIITILGGPTSYLSMMNLPREFVFAVGAIWYALTLFLFIGVVMLGR